jgi:low temperature requirement protein LtrA
VRHQHPTPDGWQNEATAPFLRAGARESSRVLPVELFFDLVYVLAITQLTHYLLNHLTVRGAAETLLLLLAVWLSWINIVWITNYFDLRARSVRLTLIGLMLVSLVASSSLPEAFDGRGATVAAAVMVLLAGPAALALAAVGREHPLGAVFERVLVWCTVLGVLGFAGGLVEGDGRIVIWVGGTLLVYGAMWLGFPLPRLGHSHTTDYTINGEHMAERCLLFVTIALGESIIITGSNFGELPMSTERSAALVMAFVGSAAIWWIYFDRGAEAGREIISAASDPGRLGLIAYTYCHIPIVAGIIVAAAGDEIAIAQPDQEVSAGEAALILGGPALYLVGHSLFKLALWGHLSPSRLAGIAALAALVPLAVVSPALMLITAATAVLLGVVIWDLLMGRRYEAQLHQQPVTAELEV